MHDYFGHGSFLFILQYLYFLLLFSKKQYSCYMKLCRSGQTLADSKGNERNKAGIVSCTYKFKQFTDCGTLRDASLCLRALMEYFTLVLSSCFLNAEKLDKKEWPSVQSVVVSSWICLIFSLQS